MKIKFYSIGVGDKQGAVKIKTNVSFKSGSHIPNNSEMIVNNFFQIVKGTKFYDVLGFVDSFEHFAISKRLKNLLEANNVNGWKCFPIDMNDSSNEYYVFQPSFVAGEILNLEKVNRYEEKLKFDINTWDGSGIFTLKNTTLIICTEDLKKILEDYKITNLAFREL